MRKQTTWVTGLIIAVSIAVVPFAYAQHVGGGHEHGFQFLEHLAHVRQQLDLTDSQVDQLKAIGAALKEQNAPYKKQLRANLHSVATALLANPNDLAGAETLLDQQNDAERAMKANTLSAASRALNVLTSEQRNKLADIIAKRWAAHD